MSPTKQPWGPRDLRCKRSEPEFGEGGIHGPLFTPVVFATAMNKTKHVANAAGAVSANEATNRTADIGLLVVMGHRGRTYVPFFLRSNLSYCCESGSTGSS